MTSLTPSALIATAKSSGRVPPSLVSEDRIIDGGIFESTLSKCLDEGLNLSSDLSTNPSVAETFSFALKIGAEICPSEVDPFTVELDPSRSC
eukprot:scaffold31160_cov73-Cyclotella_meneghiniana.AAC.3